MLIFGIIVAILGAVGSVGAIYVAWLAYHRDTQNDDTQADERRLTNLISTLITAALLPVFTKIDNLTESVNERHAQLDKRLAVEETTMKMVFDYYNQLVLGATKGMHQPDPRRFRIDYLLEKMQAEFDPDINAPETYLTEAERNELQHYLEMIIEYKEHGSVDNMVRDEEAGIEFPYYPFDSVFAAILLPALKVEDESAVRQ